MNKFYNETLHKLETAINELEIEADCSIQRMEAVIHLILECLSEVKEPCPRTELCMPYLCKVQTT